MKKSQYLKVVTHVPSEYLKQVQKAIWDVGAGKEGNYSHCSFVLPGKGYFIPLEGSDPAIWDIWISQEVEEYHLEFTCHKDILETVIKTLKKVHPYEEVPIQIFEYFEL